MTRPWYPTKAAWAAAQAAQKRREADALPVVPAADWRGIKRRMAYRDALLAEARKFERIAARHDVSGR